MYRRCIIMVADGGRADLMTKLLNAGELPNIKKHITDRGSYRIALTVFPSTTGPAHIPFVCGVHPGTANFPGYRWLCRETHDRRRRSISRHRSLNSPRGMCVGRDLPQSCTSLFEHFENPSSIFELIDLCRNRHLFKVRLRRLYRIVQAHRNDNWELVDRAVEQLTIERINADSHCIISSFFRIDEYSHLYGPFDERTVDAYRKIDCSIGHIVNRLKERGIYDETILAVVSDHGLTATHTHIPVVDIVREHGFDPHYYPRIYRRRCDSAVMESGNSMVMLYFKRGRQWGEHWEYNELKSDPRSGRLMKTLVNTNGISFLIVRDGEEKVVIVGKKGTLRASLSDGRYDISLDGESPLPDHPTGNFRPEELMEMTYEHIYPDAVNQAFMLFRSPRSGDILVSSDPGYDLRWQHENPEHFGSHGSLHRDHMKVPLALSVPFKNEKVYNYDIVPTILKLCGKKPDNNFDGRLLEVDYYRSGVDR